MNNIHWSEHPGCFERHLLRKHQFPVLFGLGANAISVEDVERAKEQDERDRTKLQEKFTEIARAAANSKKGHLTMSDIKGLRELIDDLLERTAEIGLSANDVRDGILDFRKAIMEDLEHHIQGLPEALAKFKIAEENYYAGLDFMLDIFGSQFHRSDTPISASEYIPALMTEDSKTIRRQIEGADEKLLAQIQVKVLDLLLAAEREGKPFVRAQECLNGFGIKKSGV